ncbi:fibronectin type III domain-containing protein [Paractinoplanes toevensis]|uniref:Fibronectin type-III domain-containing protein n=1 Tax=Paractinoplanes toevensis TaxID=571911 RepID=A0A919W305_9ACTN|nr:fibronectin type III domain-containing protein [Actinoplanes toevensis]GIM94217.1 hypothetical protein Ato02nite_060100 [Actinoplanes toevensis]
MLRRLGHAAAAAATIAFCLAVPTGRAAAVPPMPPPNLIANGNFDHAYLQPGPAPWTCGPGARVVQLDPDLANDFQLAGTPTARSTAGCWQIIPVQPDSQYELTGRFKDGYAELGTDYGSASAPGSADWSTLSLSFVTGPDTSRIRVYVHGGYGQSTFHADAITLNGPESTVVTPIAPTHVQAAEQRSTSVSLRWVGSPGATRYLVYRDGTQIGTAGALSWTSYYVRDVTPGSTHTYTVAAVNAAGTSPTARPVASTAPRAYDTPPPAPTAIKASVTGRTAYLSWNAVPTATDGYVVRFVEMDNNVTVFANHFSTRLPAPGTYTVTISSWNSAGRGPESTPVNLTAT